MATPIPYARKLVMITAEQLDGWKQLPQEGTPLPVLIGDCPSCGHRCQAALTNVVVMGGKPAAAEDRQPERETTRQIICNCGDDHTAPADTPGGCGRYWLVRLTRNEQDTGYDLAPEDDLSLLAPTAALNEALATEGARVRGAAEKWLGAITAIYSLFSLTGVATAKDALAGISSNDKRLVALALVTGLLLAVVSLLFGYFAAYGWPVPRDVGDNPKLRKWHTEHRAHAATAAGHLHVAVLFAIGSLAALTVVMLLVWFLPRAG